MKKNFKLFCFGFGQVAKYFVKNLLEKDFDFDLITTNTSKTQLNKFDKIKYKSYYFIDNKFDNNLLAELNSSNKVLISIPPQNQTDVVLKTFGESFKKKSFNWVTYLSATNIYGDKKGDWVDENTKPEPTSDKGMARLNAENNWLKYFKDFNLPVQIFRLTGIYSVESNVVKRLKMGTLKLIEKKNHFFSRIHVEDIAEILTLSLTKFNPGQIFNLSDNYPCSNEEIAKYASNLVKINLPKKIQPKDITNNMLKSFYKDSKKVSNKKMINFFGYDLKYPTYKEGLEIFRDHKT